jgi:poly(glycerol-phosphate) alpha-glucosyltransferase
LVEGFELELMNGRELPSGRYLTITIDVHPDYGGQTRALLMRNRIFAKEGANADVLMVGATSDLDWRRETLRERGLLSDGLDLLNIYEHYRDTDWPGEEPTDTEPPDLSAHVTRETTLPDGAPWRRTYRLSNGRVIYDYLRPDGSTFIRMPNFSYRAPATWPSDISRISRDGRVVGGYRSPAVWYRRWLRDLSDGEQTFVFLDSRFMVPLVAPMKAPNVHLAYLMHNIHIGGERRWDSPSGEVYERVLALKGGLDAFVNLTQRQGEDIAARCGRTSNMFVVPNPVDLPPEPPVVERDPRLVSVVARLEGQKRISDAVKAFAHVLEELPDARLEIYGKGSRHDAIQRVIDRLELGGSVTLKGHDPHARDALWRSSAFMMTSLFEGYPLSTLESLSHGCPVVSYDIKYGPREQITDGQDGFVVEPGDTRALADRVIELLKDPALVRRMSKAARAKATQHGYDRFLSDWGAVLIAAVEQKPRRTNLTSAELEVRRLTIGRGKVGPGRFAAGKRLHLKADLTVTGQGDKSEAEVTLAAVHEGSGLIVDLPMSVNHAKGVFRLTASVPLSDLYATGASAQDRCRLRVRLTWRNSSWQTYVTRPKNAPAGLEVDFGPDDVWLLSRR